MNTDASAGAPAPTDEKRCRLSRRKFIAASSAVLTAGAGLYYGTRRRITLGLVGVGQRGEYHAQLLRWMSYGVSPYGRVLAICDTDIDRATLVRDAQWPSAEVHQDYRQVLANKEIEAIFIATHDSSHAGIAIEAMRAGKAVYIEKPISVTVEEGFTLREVAERTKSIVQVGTQQRSHTPFHQAWELVNNGRLGELKKIVVTVGKTNPPSGLSSNESLPPQSLDWNMWLGPTPEVPYCEFRQRGWHTISDYASGELTNWGAHQMDIALWVSGNHQSYPVTVTGSGSICPVPVGEGVPSEFSVSLDYPNGINIDFHTASSDLGILFDGNRGKIFVNRSRISGKPVEELASNPLPPDAVRVPCRRSPGSSQKLSALQHYRDFFDCIRLNETPVSDIKSSVCVHTALHLANNAIVLGRPLRFDAESMSIHDDPEATALLSRTRRPEFAI